MSQVILFLICVVVLVLVTRSRKSTALVPALRRALVQPSDRVVPSTGYSLQIQVLEDPNPATSVLAQSQLGPAVILWPLATKWAGWSAFGAFCGEAHKYPNIAHCYVYDELYWNGHSVDLTLDQPSITTACAQSRAAGLITVVSVMPDVLLHKDFTLAHLAGVDVVGLDLYPSIPPQTVTAGVGNPWVEYVRECVAKLRSIGFTGEVWYLYQAFGMHTETAATLLANLTAQRVAIDSAQELGCAGIVPWGLYLGAHEIEREPYLFQLAETEYERLVVPWVIP